MKIAYAGTPDFAVPALQGLIDAEADLVGVWTQPDRPAGRGRKLKPSPVKAAALAAGLPVHQPVNFKEPEALETLLESGAELLVVAAYGLLLPRPIIDGFKLGCVNLHASKLPRWRGAAPIQRAIQAGDQETALGLMRMEIGLDTGPVLDEAVVAIEPHHTAGELQDLLAAQGWPLLQRNWERLAAGVPGTAQSSDGIEYAKKITKAEAEIDFNQPSDSLIRHIHAFNPAPGAWCEGPLGRIKLLNARPSNTILPIGELGPDGQVGCQDGAITVTRWQLPGKPPQSVTDLLNAGKLPLGLKLV